MRSCVELGHTSAVSKNFTGSRGHGLSRVYLWHFTSRPPTNQVLGVGFNGGTLSPLKPSILIWIPADIWHLASADLVSGTPQGLDFYAELLVSTHFLYFERGSSYFLGYREAGHFLRLLKPPCSL